MLLLLNVLIYLTLGPSSFRVHLETFQKLKPFTAGYRTREMMLSQVFLHFLATGYSELCHG